MPDYEMYTDRNEDGMFLHAIIKFENETEYKEALAAFERWASGFLQSAHQKYNSGIRVGFRGGKIPDVKRDQM